MNRAAIIAEALEWVGTPYHANQRAKGIGADCIGLVAGVALAIGLPVNGLSSDYSPKPDGRMQPYLDAHLDRVTVEASPGNVLLICLGREPHHLAIFANAGQIIHAYRPAGKCVVQSYTDYWRGVTVAAYRFKGVE
jgi:cell wall-associated NlpC family hydrolase